MLSPVPRLVPLSSCVVVVGCDDDCSAVWLVRTCWESSDCERVLASGDDTNGALDVGVTDAEVAVVLKVPMVVAMMALVLAAAVVLVVL